MRLGIGSWTYPWSIGVPGYEQPERPLAALDLLRKAKGFGLGLVQICDNIALDRLGEADLLELAGAAGRMGITIQTGTRGVTPEQLMRHLSIAKVLGSKLLRTITDTAGCEPDKQQVVSWIREVLPDFEKAGVRIAIENHDRFTCAELAELIETIGSDSVGICLDTANSFGALESTGKVVDVLAPHTINLHVKDFGIERIECKMGFLITGRPAGRGRLDLDDLFARMVAAGRSPDVILEQWPPYLGSVKQSMQNEEQWTQDSVAFLKGKLAAFSEPALRSKANGR